MHNFNIIQGIMLQLYKMIKDIERKCSHCSVQEPWLYFALFPFIKFSCPGHNFKTIQGMVLKLHKMLKDIVG